jgi:FKBP-type peptidyl-prolyl cis-trans isomerase
VCVYNTPHGAMPHSSPSLAKWLSILLGFAALIPSDSLALTPISHRRRSHQRASVPFLLAAKKKSGPKKKASGGGFGSAGAGFGASREVKLKAPKSLSPEERRWQSFMDWVAASGGSVDAVRLADCGDGLRGLKATRDLARGEEIIRIPRSIIIDVARAEASPVSGVWRQHGDASVSIPGYIKIALAVLLEQRRGAESDVAPYLEMLPSQEDFERDGGPAAMWSDEELALTECGKLVDAAKRRREQSRGDGHPALTTEALAATWRDLELSGAAPSADELSWAVTAVTSRAYGVGSPAPGAPPESGLVPVVDMANHDGRYPQHTAKGLEEDGNSFVVLATEAIKRNTQVCLTYGDLSNFYLLPQFGFVLPELGPPTDHALVDCAHVVKYASEADGGSEKLAGLAADGLLMCDADGTPSVWQRAGHELQAAVLRLAESGMLPPPPGDDDDATAAAANVRALAAYRAMLSNTLSGYSTTVAEDRTALGLAGGATAEPMMAPRTRLAVEFRMTQKALLNHALATLGKEGAAGITDAANRLQFQLLGARAYAEALEEPGAVQTPSGLIINHKVEGDGPQPKVTDTVQVHYEGKNADGMTFDSSYANGEPTTFALRSVIAGWTEGLQLMRVGGKARLTIPYQLGYGEKGSPPKIPSKATLLFTVELLAITK